MVRDVGPPPVQVCPRGDFVEQAIRRFSALTPQRPLLQALRRRFRDTGRCEVAVSVEWISTRCPRCGSMLRRNCPGCNAFIVSPDDSHCRDCGHAYPWAVARRERGLVSIRNWRERAERTFKLGDRTTIYAMKGDIRSVSVDAMVAADDPEGRMIGDVADAIVRAGGHEIEQESVDKALGKLGTAWSTGAGRLGQRYVIHVAIIDYDMTTKAEFIRDAMRNSLIEADRVRVKSVAYPALGTGVSQFPFDASGMVMGQALVRYFSGKHQTTLEDVVFVLFGEEPFVPFLEGLEKAVGETLDGAAGPPASR